MHYRSSNADSDLLSDIILVHHDIAWSALLIIFQSETQHAEGQSVFEAEVSHGIMTVSTLADRIPIITAQPSAIILLLSTSKVLVPSTIGHLNALRSRRTI